MGRYGYAHVSMNEAEFLTIVAISAILRSEQQ